MARRTDKKLATFNIDAERWEAFKAKADSNGTNASALLNQWVSEYLDQDIDNPQSAVNKNALIAAVGEAIRECLPAAIQEIAALQQEHRELGGDESSKPPSKREFEQMQVKAYRLENSHRIALSENETLQKQIRELRKELAESKRQVASQQKELAYLQRVGGDGTDDSPATCAQLPDLYLIREQVIREHRAGNKLNEHAYKIMNLFIEEIQKGLGDYSHLKGLLDEIERQKLYYQGAIKQRDEIAAKYDTTRKRLHLLGEPGW